MSGGVNAPSNDVEPHRCGNAGEVPGHRPACGLPSEVGFSGVWFAWSGKPSEVVLVYGLCHQPVHMELLADEMHHRGMRVHVPRLPPTLENQGRYTTIRAAIL